jgi:CRP-like cAMP-binding protein
MAGSALPGGATPVSDHDLTSRLAAHPLLDGFSADEVATLATSGSLSSVGPREAIFRQGDPADALCLLLDGSVRVTMRGGRGFDHELASVGAGSTLGALGLLGGGERGATVRAVEASSYFLLPTDAVERLLVDGHPAAVKLLGRLARTVAARLRTMNERICELTEDQEHPDGTVRLKISDIRERLLRAGAAGL